MNLSQHQRLPQPAPPQAFGAGSLGSDARWPTPAERDQVGKTQASATSPDFHLERHSTLVREMVARHAIELVLILVIITYLIYYFTKISSRPKLIGDRRSQFVNSVRSHLSDTLNRRFNPLLYFWGTNPQTCLFGYLQGQTTSDKDMPRSKFKRQYLYISDAQYLTSNVDLGAYYPEAPNSNKLVHRLQLEGKRVASGEQQQQQPVARRRLDENLRLALNGMLKYSDAGELVIESPGCPNSKARPVEIMAIAAETKPPQQQKLAEGPAADTQLLRSQHSTVSSASSADSGVFNSSRCSNSSSSSTASRSSSASSLSEVCTGSGAASSSSSSGADDEQERDSSLGASSGCESELPASQRRQELKEQREFGQCALDWYLDSHRNYRERKQVALISAGMTTGSDKQYVTDTARTLEALGYEVCVFIRRGVGGLALSSAKFFSPSKWHDFEAAVRSVRQQRPGARLVAVGFSFGSIELCRYLSMSGRRSQVDAALLVSCPFDPEAGGRNMRRRALNRRIDAYLARNLGKQLHWALLDGAPEQPADERRATSQLSNYNGSLIDLAKLPKIKSLVEFEDEINRRLQHYPSSAAYADDSRLSAHLHRITTPTLCLSSEDDFMAPLRLLPVREIAANPNLCMLLTRRGGHMAFIDGLLWPTRPYFAQRVIAAYLPVIDELLGAQRAQVKIEMGAPSS